MQTLSDKGVKALAGLEAIVLTRYRDSVGVWTIGVGHTKAAGGLDPEKYEGALTVDEALDMFRRDLLQYESGVNDAFAGIDLPQACFDAAVMFHYNTGAIGRAGWVNHAKKGRWATARDDTDSGIMAWRTPIGLLGRRMKERDLFFFGLYPQTEYALIIPANLMGKLLFKHAKKFKWSEV